MYQPIWRLTCEPSQIAIWRKNTVAFLKKSMFVEVIFDLDLEVIWKADKVHVVPIYIIQDIPSTLLLNTPKHVRYFHTCFISSKIAVYSVNAKWTNSLSHLDQKWDTRKNENTKRTNFFFTLLKNFLFFFFYMKGQNFVLFKRTQMWKHNWDYSYSVEMCFLHLFKFTYGCFFNFWHFISQFLLYV